MADEGFKQCLSSARERFNEKNDWVAFEKAKEKVMSVCGKSQWNRLFGRLVLFPNEKRQESLKSRHARSLVLLMSGKITRDANEAVDYIFEESENEGNQGKEDSPRKKEVENDILIESGRKTIGLKWLRKCLYF